MFAAKQEAAADFGRGRDDGEEHAGQVEVPEVAGDLHPVVEEGDDGDGEVESTAYVVSLDVLEVRGEDFSDTPETVTFLTWGISTVGMTRVFLPPVHRLAPAVNCVKSRKQDFHQHVYIMVQLSMFLCQGGQF